MQYLDVHDGKRENNLVSHWTKTSNLRKMEEPQSVIPPAIDRLLQEGISGLGEVAALDKLAVLIDLSFDLRSDEGTTAAIEWGINMELKVTSVGAPALDYLLSNAWANRYAKRSEKRVWGWEQPEYEKQIFYLKRATNREGFPKAHDTLKCRIFTNLGNCLSTIGRFVEAQEAWRKALSVVPDFGMALGNRAFGASRYLHALYDPWHRTIFARFASSEYRAALQPNAMFCDTGANVARDGYLAELARLEEAFGVTKDDFFVRLGQKHISLGRSKAERDYRIWCLNHRLFLNPLNDIIELPLAAQDILSMPSITCSVEQQGPPPIIGFYNQLKQEFVSARWSYYAGLTKAKFHFSDREVMLPNTLDYSSLCLAVEELKSSFRAAYSLFDKIAYFINQYFQLGLPDKKVWFRKIWYEPNKTDIRADLESTENWALRGLFWLSKDLYEESQDTSDPDAQELAYVRNHLEHKFLRIHEFKSAAFSSANSQEGLGFSISRSRFQELTFHLLTLSRCALIYLSLAVENEERRRSCEGLTIPMFLPPMDDKWKV